MTITDIPERLAFVAITPFLADSRLTRDELCAKAMEYVPEHIKLAAPDWVRTAMARGDHHEVVKAVAWFEGWCIVDDMHRAQDTVLEVELMLDARTRRAFDAAREMRPTEEHLDKKLRKEFVGALKRLNDRVGSFNRQLDAATDSVRALDVGTGRGRTQRQIEKSLRDKEIRAAMKQDKGQKPQPYRKTT